MKEQVILSLHIQPPSGKSGPHSKILIKRNQKKESYDSFNPCMFYQIIEDKYTPCELNDPNHVLGGNIFKYSNQNQLSSLTNYLWNSTNWGVEYGHIDV